MIVTPVFRDRRVVLWIVERSDGHFAFFSDKNFYPDKLIGELWP